MRSTQKAGPPPAGFESWGEAALQADAYGVVHHRDGRGVLRMIQLPDGFTRAFPFCGQCSKRHNANHWPAKCARPAALPVRP